MIPRRIDEISFDDIHRLVINEVRESRTLEYKSQLPHEGESSKIPFLAAISALANTDGGDLIFGIVDTKGAPTELPGIEANDPDKEVLRIEHVILTGIEPRIPTIFTRIIRCEDRYFIVVRVGKSWNSPHRVTFKNHSKFYKRNSAGKYPMDVSELRTAFLQTEQIVERIRKFRSSRIEKLKAENELPVNLNSGAKISFHLIPLVAFANSQYLSFGGRNDITLSLRPIGCSGWNHRYNLDGIVTSSGDRYGTSSAYTQIFRNGIIEAVSSLMGYSEDKHIASQAYESELIEATRSYFGAYRLLEVESPIYFFISIIGIRNYIFSVSNRMFLSANEKTSDRDDLILPEGIFQDLNAQPHKQLQPFFDMIWNAYGYERSFNYDDKGNWVGQR